MSFSKDFEKLDLSIHGVRLPEIQIHISELKKVGLQEDSCNYDYLRALCLENYKRLGLNKNKKTNKIYGERVKYELEIFKELGFVDYVLLVWDVINFCSNSGIPTGLGRGSAAGSLVLYLIGVTKIDPIKYDLYFERFVSKVRAKKKVVDGVTYLDGSLMCDVDLDICYYRRGEVIKYLDEKFKGKTSKILTFNTLSSKLLIKEVGKIVGRISDQEMTLVTKMIPKKHGIVADLETAVQESEDFQEWADKNQLIYNTALKLRNLNKNKGVHPSGVLVSHFNLNTICPTELASDKTNVSSYDMNWSQLLNVKLDALGLRSVSVVDDICKSVGIKMEEIDLNDPEIYRNLQDLKNPHGLFQIEARTAFETVKEVKPKNLEELSAVLALARPGAMDYIKPYSIYSNTGEYNSIHPFFDDILGYTGGVCLYQEQMMKMAHKIGFTLDEAEILRRIVGKKKVDQVAEWQDKIKDKVKENKLDPAIGDVLWKVLEDSANYSFNKSHSICYAALAACTIYLKFKYPQQFFLSLLKMTKHEPDSVSEVSKIEKEMFHFGIKLLAPNILRSSMDFSIEGSNIRFGLLSIKGISEKSIEKINGFRDDYDNKFEVFEAAKSCGINLGALSALVQAGSLDEYKNSRSYTVYQAQLWSILTQREKKFALSIGHKYDFNLVQVLQALSSMKDDKGKPCIKESRRETIKKKSENYTSIFDKNKKNERLANWWYETRLLGYSFSSSLAAVYDKIPNIIPVRSAKVLPKKAAVTFAGIVFDKTIRSVSKNGNPYAKIFLKDETSEISVMIFSERYKNYIEENKHLPKENEILVVKGTVADDNTIFANMIAPQSGKIYTKLSDLKS